MSINFTNFVEQAEPAKDEQDPRQKRLKMIKRQVLMKKVQAVRQGAGEDITASYEPDGELVDEGMYDIDPKTGESPVATAVNKANKMSDKKRLKSLAKLSKKLVGEEALEEKKGEKNCGCGQNPCITYGDDRHKKDKVEEGKKGLWDNIHAKRKRGEKPAKPGDKDYPKTLDVDEGVLSMIGKKKKVEKKPEKAMDAGARGRRMIQRRVHAKYVSGSEDNVPDDIRDHYEVQEAKVDKGRSDYGKASIRNYRRSGPGHGEPAMFDSENKRGKTIDKRREEHKARRGVKGAKVPAYKVEGTSYGLYKGDGKAKGAMKDFLDKKAAKLKKAKDKQSAPYKNNPAFGDASHHSNRKTRTEQALEILKYNVVQDVNLEEKSAAWQRKEGKNKKGGLNEKGRKSYERENPGSDLKAPQPEGGPRKRSFCARMGGVKGPMKKPNGEPTRKALALRKWKCSESSDWRNDVEMNEGIGSAAKAVGRAAGNTVGYAAKVASGVVGQGVQALSKPDLKPNIDVKPKTGGVSANKNSLSAKKKALDKIKKDRRERATTIMTVDKAAKKVKKESDDKKFKADSEKPIVAEFVQNLFLTKENYRAMRNPKEDKPESEMSYDEKRKKRMNDPKKGINSPAFKEFMRKQGM